MYVHGLELRVQALEEQITAKDRLLEAHRLYRANQEALEEQIASRDNLIAAYRLRERNQQEAADRLARLPMRCPAVSPQGSACELDNRHDGSHTRRGDGVTRSWGW